MVDNRSVFIGGLNVDAPNMGSNGAGKSLIIDAIYWCLYGLRIRAQGKDDVIGSHDSFTMAKTTWIDDSDRKIEITRYRKHSKHKNDAVLKIDGRDASKFRVYRKLGTNQQIVKVLGVSDLAFLHSVIFSKSRSSICDKPPAERTRLLSHIIGLDVIDNGLKAAKSDRKKFIELVHRYDVKINTEKTRLNENLKRIKDLEESLEQTSKRQNELDEEVERWNRKLKKRIRKLNKRGFELQIKLDKFTPQAMIQRGLREQLRKLDSKQSKFSIRSSRALAKLEARLEKYKEARRAVTKCKEQSGIDCPTCKQYISPGHIRQRIFELKKHLNKESIAKKRAARSYQSIQRKLSNKNEQISTLKLQIDKDIEHKCLELNSSIKSITQEVKILKQSRTKKSVGDDSQKLKEKIEHLKYESLKIKDNLELASTKYKEISEQLAIAEFWCEGFGPKGLKRFVINSILNVLESKTNEYLEYLTDGYMSAEWVGNIEEDARDKLQILVLTGSRKKRDYLVCSEGERARVWLSTELALNDIRRVSIDIALVDECFDGLSTQGVRKAIELITNESLHRKMICISHKEGVERFFDRRFKVVFKKETSELLQPGEIDAKRKPRPESKAA